MAPLVVDPVAYLKFPLGGTLPRVAARQFSDRHPVAQPVAR